METVNKESDIEPQLYEYFTINELCGRNRLSTPQMLLIANALKQAHNLLEMDPPLKLKSSSTGFVCNHYSSKFKEQTIEFLKHIKDYEEKSGKDWFYEAEKVDLMNKFFLNSLGLWTDTSY